MGPPLFVEQYTWWCGKLQRRQLSLADGVMGAPCPQTCLPWPVSCIITFSRKIGCMKAFFPPDNSSSFLNLPKGPSHTLRFHIFPKKTWPWYGRPAGLKRKQSLKICFPYSQVLGLILSVFCAPSAENVSTPIEFTIYPHSTVSDKPENHYCPEHIYPSLFEKLKFPFLIQLPTPTVGPTNLL